MAQIIRAASVAAPPNVTANRAAGLVGGRQVLSPDAAPIQELSPGVGVYYGDGGLPFHDEGQGLGERRRGVDDQTGRGLVNVGGISSASTEFAAFFETNQVAADRRGYAGGPGDVSSGIFVAAAIGRYETNAKVIAGTNDPRGESINMSL